MDMQYVGAHVIRGGEHTLEALVVRLELEKVTERSSPDLFQKSYRSFGVADAEDLRGRVRMRPVRDEQRIFALFVPILTTEAQNALLKTLEEPAAGAVLFLVTPSPETLLATIRSRVQMLHVEARRGDSRVDIDAFLAASPDKRLLMLKSLYEHEDDGRDIGGVIAFLQALEYRLAGLIENAGARTGLRAVYRARKYCTDKGSLLKSLLEQVALLAPTL